MEIVNLITLIVGIIVILIGLAAFFNPNFARIINAPGSPRLKAIIAMVVGVIIVTISLIVQFPR
jgi:hypothetical protein